MKANWKLIVAGSVPALCFLLYRKTKAMEQASTEAKNLRAFLVMIQYAEGTFGKDAYRKVFGGGTITTLKWHPNVPITKGGITSTAAGAYQILGKTWEELSTRLRLTDFGPVSQDKAAVELIRRRKALSDVLAGRFGAAITKCRKEWASLPGAGYNQRERSKQSLLAVYKIAGGTTTA